MLLDKAMEGNGIIQEKYITVTVLKSIGEYKFVKMSTDEIKSRLEEAVK